MNNYIIQNAKIMMDKSVGIRRIRVIRVRFGLLHQILCALRLLCG